MGRTGFIEKGCDGVKKRFLTLCLVSIFILGCVGTVFAAEKQAVSMSDLTCEEIDDNQVEFIKMTHSIADAVAVAITTPVGVVFHTGDFKIDYTPIDGEMMDFQRIAELGRQGITLLMSDSTNVLRPGYTMSESSVGREFDKIFNNCNKRIIVATFASNIHRMQQIVNSAVKNKRKVAVVGRSMLNVMTVSQELGYISMPEGTLIDIDKINNYNPEQLVIITTGSQ